MECKSLEEVRANIDRIDDNIIKLIGERTDYVRQAAKFKTNTDGVKAPDRVEAVIRKVRGSAEKYGADADMVESLYREMISRFVDMETREFEKGKAL
ncbi:MAG: chorismate mutase [Oscillospiraceae bacterium]|nr:chorismate mutase [Oscillospiraceae bacterium]